MIPGFRRWLPLILLSLLLAGVVGLRYYQLWQKARSIRPPPPPTVAVSQVRKEVWRRELRAVGGLSASAAVAVSSELAGKVVAIEFTSGQYVEAGQVLVRLDTTVERAELDALTAAAELARLDLARLARLRARRFVSQADYDAAKARLDEARARVRAKRAVIAKKTIRAPFSGFLGIRRVDPGQYLEAGKPIVTLTALDPIYADFTLPQRHLSRLKAGLEVRIRVSPYPERWFAGKIQAIAPDLDVDSRNVRIRAVLANPEGRLRPGMFADVRIRLPGRREVLTLPETAVVFRPYGDAVYVVEAEGDKRIVRLRPVETGAHRQGRVEIVKGIAIGESVVSAGQLKLRPGMAVRVVPAPAELERP